VFEGGVLLGTAYPLKHARCYRRRPRQTSAQNVRLLVLNLMQMHALQGRLHPSARSPNPRWKLCFPNWPPSSGLYQDLNAALCWGWGWVKWKAAAGTDYLNPSQTMLKMKMGKDEGFEMEMVEYLKKL
jgi:hypothetical protein